MKRVLEIGYGGKPIGRGYSLDFHSFAKRLPRDIEYHGVDFVRPFVSEKESEAELYGIAGRCGMGKGKPFGMLSDSHERLLRDISKAIAQAHRVLAELDAPNIFLHDMDARNLTFDDSMFDEIHMHYFVTHSIVWPFIWEIMSEASRVLRKGGHLILTGECCQSFSSQNDGYVFVSSMKNNEHTLHAMESAGFELLHIGPGYADEELIRRCSSLHQFLLERLEEFSNAFHEAMRKRGKKIGTPGARFSDKEAIFIARKPEGAPEHAVALEGELEEPKIGFRGNPYIIGSRYRDYYMSRGDILDEIIY